MKLIRKTLGTLLILGGFITSTNLLPAQETESAIEAEPLSLTPADVAAFPTLSEAQAAALVSALEATPTIPMEQGTLGTFYSLQHPEWPPLPADLSGSSVWTFGTFCLLSDLNYSYQAAAGVSLMKSGRRQAMTLDIPSPEDGGDTNGYGTYASSYAPVDYGTNLWLSITNVAGSVADLVLSNTLPEVPYEIQANADIARTNWVFAGWVYGSEETNWTPVSVAATNDPVLFYRVRSWEDDGSGLPIWWQMAFFGVASGVDPYDDPAGDGWNNLQKLHNGWNPNLFYTPPAPQGVTVHYNAGSGAATVSWQPSPGPVTGYVVKDSSGTTTNLSATTTSWQKNVPNIPNGGNGDPTVYKSFQVQAQYAGGNSAQSELVPLEQNTVSGRFAFGSGNSTYLSVSALPANAATLRLIQVEVDANALGDYSLNSTHEISVSMLTNGSVLIPTNWLPPIQAAQAAYGTANFNWWLQASNTDASASAGTFAWGDYYPAAGDALAIPYFDGRAQLKQNLIFLLRSGLDIPVNISGFDSNDVWSQLEYDLPTNNYAHADFYDYSGSNYFPQQVFDEFLPFEQNYFYRNFVFNLTETDPNGLLASFDTSFTDHASRRNDFIALGLLEPPPFRFQPPATSGATITSLLATNQTRWLFMSQPDFVDDLGNSPIGMVNLEGTNYLAADFRNRFGLEFLSTKMAWGNSNPETSVLYPGEGTTLGGWFYSETAQPQFSTVEYDFFSPYGIWDEATQTRIDPTMPGLPSFSPTNQSQLFIVSPGQGTRIAGYAKLAVVNGYSGVYGYLGQYFDQAYKITNGIVTTNTTGFLSPYGDFVATEPGPAALLTMPDLDTGERGTCTVYCVSLQLDKNHDGTMDATFNGPDATSQASPMVCWVNNGYIKPGSNGSLDEDLPVPQNNPNNANSAQGRITCQRDLENFFRLWICGLPAALSNQNYYATLSCTAISGSPAINLYYAETNGGTGYLTDTNVAASLVNESELATISPISPYVLPYWLFDGSNLHFLFEGAGIGEGQFTLTIYQGANAIAQTSVYIDLHDVKDMYEQAHADNVTSGLPPSDLISQCKTDHTTVAAPDESKQIVVFVHGINNSSQDYYDSTDLVFKRLYWSGYHGKVAGFRWPCAYLPPDTVVNPLDFLKAYNYNKGEFYAWKSASAFKDYLCYLTNRFAGYQIDILGHSQGNIVASEAIKQGAPFDNYILTQAAVPAQCYDAGVSFQQKFLDAETNSPTPLYTTNGGYHGYFANLTGNLINFYNTNDYALRSGTYFGVDANWEADQIKRKPENFDYLLAQSYYFHPSDGNSYAYYAFSQYTVTDMQEAKAMVARSRTHALGAQDNVGGIISSSVDLISTFNFGKTRDDHSAQFKWPIQRIWGYYDDILTAYNLQHVAR